MTRKFLVFFLWTLTLVGGSDLHATMKKCPIALKSPSQELVPKSLPEVRSQFETIIDRYQETLGIHWNPFLTFAIFDLTEAEKLWNSLTQSSDQKPIQKMLDLILQRASVHPSHRDKYNPPLQSLIELEKQILHFLDSTRLESSHILEFQANLIAAKLALDFVDSLIPQSEESPKPESDPSTQDESETKNQDKAQNEGGDTPPDPKYPKLPKVYPPPGLEPDMDKSSASKNKKSTQLQQFNFSSPYLRIKDFVLMTRSPLSVAEMDLFESPPPLNSGRSDKFTVVFPHGDTSLELIVPDGYHPLQPTDRRIRIRQTSSGSFHVQTTEVMERFEVYLEAIPPSKHPPNPLERRLLTQTMGIPFSEWPSKIQNLITQYSPKNQGGSSLKLAQLLEKHLKKDYSFNRKTSPTLDPISALLKGEFVCFQSAVIMAEVLRSQGIPTKVVAGFRGQSWKKKEGEPWTYVTDSGEAHAWVTAFIDGEWRTFDGTPQKISPNDDSPKSPSEYETISPEENDEEESPNSTDGETDPSAQSKKPTLSEEEEKANQEWLEKITAQIRDRTSAHQKEQQQKPKEQEDQPPDLSREDLIRELTVGSLDWDPEKSEKTNPLITRAQRLFLRYLIQPSQSGAAIHSKLPIVEAFVKNNPTAEISEILVQLKKSFEGHRPQMADWIEQIVAGFDQRSLNTSYRQLSQVFAQFELFARTLDGNSRVEAMLFLRELNEIFRGFQPLLHAKAQDLGALEDFVSTLPSLVRNALLRNYGVTSIGVNEASLRLAVDFKTGKLSEYRLISMLNSVSDFIMDGVPHPEGTRIVSWERDPMQPYGADPLPVVRAQDYFRGRPTQNHLSRLENFAQRTLMGMQVRQEYIIPDEDSQDESERVTYILVDTSGSMGGTREEFLKGLVKSFAAKAGSDVTDGNPPRLRHRLVIVPFNDTLMLDKKIILDTQESMMKFIDGTEFSIPQAGGGTDIEEGLVQALGQIAADVQSGEQRKRPLSAGNVLLISDGQSNVKYDRVRTAREAIGREIPVQMMFVSLDGDNPTLKALSQDSKQMGTEIAFYRDFEGSEMESFLRTSKSIPLSDSNTFFSNHQPSDLNVETRKRLDGLPRKLKMFERRYKANEDLRGLNAARILQIIEGHTSQRPDPAEKGKLYTWLQDLRGFIYPIRKFLASEKGGTYGPWADRMAVDLHNSFQTITGRRIEDLTIAEIETLKHCLRFLNAPD